MDKPLRSIPSVERVRQALGDVDLPRPVVTAVVRRQLVSIREEGQVPGFEIVLARVREALEALAQSRIRPVINATGILIHTNLGRAPLARQVQATLTALASSYTNLEVNLTSGQRGGRADYLEHNLALLCQAEAATVVNNCAAALVLTLRHFTSKRLEVIISRGELVQIGGGFRIPELLEASGARLREVGTTNKTLLDDYARAIGPDTGLILKVHRSNFYMGGFVESPPREEMAALARRKRIPFAEDLGSGAAISTRKLGLEHEPTPAEVLAQGVDVVTFSGDKLLGGPQGGIIAGRAKPVYGIKREPLFRALRCDKLTLAALQTTVDLYLSGDAETCLPVLLMLRVSEADLRARAEALAKAVSGLPLEVAIGTGKAQMGGGTLPRSIIPSVTLDLLPQSIPVGNFAARLRQGHTPVVGYVAGGKLKLDLRTVFPEEDPALIGAIRAAASTGQVR